MATNSVSDPDMLHRSQLSNRRSLYLYSRIISISGLSHLNSGSSHICPAILIVALCAGCAATPQQSVYLGSCKELLVSQKVWDGREEAFVGSVLLTAIDNDSVFWTRKKVVGSIGAGTQVNVKRILKDWNGSYGHFLRVQVEILEGPFRGWIAEVPSIAPYHPEPSWIIEHTLDPNALQFNPEIVKGCDRFL